jgi:hypothetical protein
MPSFLCAEGKCYDSHIFSIVDVDDAEAWLVKLGRTSPSGKLRKHFLVTFQQERQMGKHVKNHVSIAQTCTIRRPVAAADSTAATRSCLGCIFCLGPSVTEPPMVKVTVPCLSQNGRFLGLRSTREFCKLTRLTVFVGHLELQQYSARLAILRWAVSDALCFAFLHSDLLIEHNR